MQTVYYATSNYIRHEGNLVDLCEFRRKLSLTREGSLAPRPEQDPAPRPAREEPALTLLPAGEKKGSRGGERAAWVLDACASLGVIVMTLSFALSLF